MSAPKNRVAEARKAFPMTREELANAAGLSVRGLADIETHRAEPRTSTKHSLATALKVSPSQLVPDEEAVQQARGSISPEDVPKGVRVKVARNLLGFTATATGPAGSATCKLGTGTADDAAASAVLRYISMAKARDEIANAEDKWSNP
jgi:DNA-binding XRE family transcriptional regulator